MSDSQVTIGKPNPTSQFWTIKGRIFDDFDKAMGCPVMYSREELTELRDEIDRVIPRDPEPKGSYAQVVYGDAVEVNETILDALLDAKSMTTCEAAVKAYLVERGVVVS